MKKNLLFIGLLLAMSLTASAQYKGFSFGFKVGPNLGWTGSTTGAAVNEGTKMGCDLGVVAEYYFADNYAIVTGVNVDFLRGHYSFENGRMVETDTVPAFETCPVDRVFKTTVYEVPLMLKMVTNEVADLPLRFYAEVGGGIGYNHKVMVKDAIDGADAPDTWSKSNNEFSNLRASLKLGTGAQYAIDHSTRVFAGLYFSHDFINNINYISPNYCGYYYDNDGNKLDVKRDPKLNLLHNRIGLEVGILF